MKIGETKPVRGIAATRDDKSSARKPTVAATGGAAETTDSASVLGVPEAELTPKVRAAIMTLMEEVERLRRDLAGAQTRLSQLEQLADQDTLAPVANRRAFVRELSRIISYGQRYGTASSLIYFDVNGFKQINDTHGHAAGDAALLHVADILTRQVRGSDVVGRLGGDEFGVILTHTDEQTANVKAAALAADIAAAPVAWGDGQFIVSVAYGVTGFAGDETTAGDAMAAADKAMYAHKATIKGNS